MESLESVGNHSSFSELVQPGQGGSTPVKNNLVSGGAKSELFYEFLDESAATADAAGATFSEQAEKVKQLAAEIKERMIELEEINREIASGDMNHEEIIKEKNQMEQIIDAEADGTGSGELLGGGHIVGLSNAAEALADKVSIKTIYEERFSTEAGGQSDYNV